MIPKVSFPVTHFASYPRLCSYIHLALFIDKMKIKKLFVCLSTLLIVEKSNSKNNFMLFLKVETHVKYQVIYMLIRVNVMLKKAAALCYN